MRVVVTERMLREGMLRCLRAKTLSSITVSELCRESGINRATFYNHYDAPVMILKEIAYEFAEQLESIYKSNHKPRDKNDNAAVEACLSYVETRKSELNVLFSNHAENYLSSVAMEIINNKVAQNASLTDSYDTNEEYLLCAATAAAAAYGFIHIWLTKNIEKTPRELVSILKKVVQGNVFL